MAVGVETSSHLRPLTACFNSGHGAPRPPLRQAGGALSAIHPTAVVNGDILFLVLATITDNLLIVLLGGSTC